MIELAVELSSVAGSIALLRDGKPADERSWLEKSARAQHIFHELPGLLAAGGVAAADLGGFLVGRGPGSYSGLRVAITAARRWRWSWRRSGGRARSPSSATRGVAPCGWASSGW